ncbi:hypothetical protein LXL04_012726 [Taraxacum kok-saghyz]
MLIVGVSLCVVKEMDIDGSKSLTNRNQKSRGSNEEKKSINNDVSNPLFVNHAELAWHEMRRSWIGDTSQTSPTKFRQPILSWTTSFEDLLSSGEPFPHPIPLTDLVDLLVDIWSEDGLYN